MLITQTSKIIYIIISYEYELTGIQITKLRIFHKTIYKNLQNEKIEGINY